MITMEKLIQYFTQLAYLTRNGMIAAQDIRDAAAATGDISAITGAILAHAQAHGINPEEELTGLYNAQSTAAERKRKADIKAILERLQEKLRGIIADADTATHKELTAEIAAAASEAAGLAVFTEEPAAFITAEALMSKTYPPRVWLVENLITPGLTILSGAPKIGKSWLMLSLAEAVSRGGNFLSEFKTTQAGVLHLALEETERSLYERRHSLKFFSGNSNLIMTTQWESGMSGLYTYLREHHNIKLVIIDTLGRFMPEIEDMNDYAGTVRPLSHLKKTADELDIAILAVHHAKKGGQNDKAKGDWMDNSLGSQGIVGTADTTLVLQRDIDGSTGERKNTGRLYGTGRNIRDIFKKLTFDPGMGSWTANTETTASTAQEGGTKNGKGTGKDRSYGT